MTKTKIQPKKGDTFEYAGSKYTIVSIKGNAIKVKREVATMRDDGSGLYDMKPHFYDWTFYIVAQILNDPNP